MERFFKGYVRFKGKYTQIKFPNGLTIGEDKHYNSLERVNNGLQFKNFESGSIFFVPMSQVEFYEVYR